MIHNRNEMDLTDGQEWVNNVLIHARNIHTGKEFTIVKIDHVPNYPEAIEFYVLDNGDRWKCTQGRH